jgi:hypothetical protein
MSGENSGSLSSRLSPRNIDRRILFWIILILIVVIYLNPVGIPVKIVERTRAAYDTIEGIPDGSIVILSLDTTGGAWGETGPLARAAFRHLQSTNLRVAVMGLHIPDASTLQEGMFDRVGIPSNWEYGTDYIAFGYIPGREVAVAQLAEDFRGLLSKDFYQNDLDDFPLGRDLRGGEDVALIISADSVGLVDLWVRHWATPFGTKVLPFGTASAAVSAAPYYPDLVQGVVSGIRGAAEYELLINFPEDGLRSTDMLSGTHLVIIAAIIVGNILYFTTERKVD